MESEAFSIKSISIDPEVSPLGGPVNISMDFYSPLVLNSAVWKVFYQIDTIRKRKMFEVLSLDPRDFSAGVNGIIFNLPPIQIGDTQSLTAGVLVLTLSMGTEELLGINMIVQVTQKDGQIFKTIFSPLE
ncbi:hypothetical protein SteCoe_20133 [Stentor coeruleus]|uniref:Uncharacterized protein n=1 Tax=Stentor coeruleus TaxID=5963 RepID=A0A1R2BSJ4_9CILI|nr:hypothetical protein SteCoe_20133 [Stentor coeruleus]